MANATSGGCFNILIFGVFVVVFIFLIADNYKEALKYSLLSFSIMTISYFTMFPFPVKEFPSEAFIEQRLENIEFSDPSEAYLSTADTLFKKHSSLDDLFNSFNYMPFHTLKDCSWSFSVFAMQILGNIALFVPLGFSLAFFKDRLNIKKSLLIVLLSTLAIEVTQIIVDIITGYYVKAFDVDDIIFNFLGGTIGLFIGLIFIKYYNTCYKKNTALEEQ